MNNVLNRKYLIFSLIIHIAIFLIMAYVIHGNRISKTFVVFGVHSKKPSHAIMKFGNKRLGTSGSVPFVSRRFAGGGRKGSKKNVSASTTKQKDVVVEKVMKLRSEKSVALRSGVSFQKKKHAERVRQKKDRAAHKKEEKRIAREERKLREIEKLLAKQEKEERLLEQARKMQAELERAERERKEAEVIKSRVIKSQKKKELLVAKLNENNDKENEEIISSAEHADGNENEPAGDGSGEKIFAENSNDVMEFNLLGQSDQELRVYQRNIQREVMRLWHPPIGVPKGTTCRGKFTVGRDGEIELFEFVNRSKMLIYDLSIFRVAKLFKFDECLWGKRFTIDFCQ